MEIGDKKTGNVGVVEAESEVLGRDKKESPFATITTDPSTTIPNEIWVKIFSHVTQKELVRHRLVCSSWRDVVDEHFNFSVIVHEDTTDLKRLAELKIKDCLITKLNSDMDILRYPEVLKRVRFWGSIHPTSMHRILQNAINLEELSMTRYPLTQKNILPQNHILDLKKLIKLEILGYCCKDASEEVSTNVIRLISQTMPSLSKIFLNVTCYWKHMDSIIAAFFEFLAKHRKQVSHINVTLVPAANGHELISLLPTNIPQGTKDSLHDEQLQLESLRLNLATKYISCWTTIIQNQTKLTDFRINWISSYEQPPTHITGIPNTILLPAIIQSASTLVYVELRELNLSMDDTRNAIPFDASVFKCAHNLRRLILMRNKEDCQRNLELYGSPTIVNIDNILPALTDLEIIRFKCLTSELQTLVDSSQNLKSVKLQYNGSAVGQGVPGGLIELLTIKPIIKVINIFPLNYHDAEQNAKLDMLKSRYPGICQGGDHVYFDFDRYRQGIAQPQSRYHQATTSITNHEFSLDRGGSGSRFVEGNSLKRRGYGVVCIREISGAGSGPSSSRSREISRVNCDHWSLNRSSKRIRRSMSVDRLDEFSLAINNRETKVSKNSNSSSSNSKNRHRSWSVNDM